MLREEAYGDAFACWEKYLALDPNSAWSSKARDGLALCRQHLQGSA